MITASIDTQVITADIGTGYPVRGEKGFSPTVAVEKSDGVATITITDIDGAHTFTVSDGAKGDTGAQGVQGEKGEKGDTGAQGIQGEKGDMGAQGVQGEKGEKGDTGEQGADGVTPVRGTDYWTEDDKSEIVADVLAALPVWRGGAY